MFKMFKVKPKKVFEKINKMDRKQAYTLGAIILVVVVALLMLVSTLGGEDDPFDKDMKARGYDLANMPFATDAAEQYLLANAYPDMQENGSTLLYSAQEKEARQEADEQQPMYILEPVEEAASSNPEESPAATGESPSGASGSGSGSGRRGGGGGGGGKTQINQLGQANRPTSSGSAFNATYGPSVDARQLKSRENKGNETIPTLDTGNARKALSQFHSGTLAARKYKENQMTGARKALMGGYVAGSGDEKGVGIGGGGLTIDPTAPPHSTDLAPIEKKVSDMADPPEKKKEEEKLGFWEQLGQDLIREAATRLVSSVVEGVGDTIKAQMNGNAASRAARKAYGSSFAGKKWDQLTDNQRSELLARYPDMTEETWNGYSDRQRRNRGSQTATAWSQGKEQKEIVIGQARKDSAEARKNSNVVKCPDGSAAKWDAEKKAYQC